jgi:DnaJ-class molecular chaperone
METYIGKCYHCEGSGISIFNDFSDPYQVTQYEHACIHCEGAGELEYAKEAEVRCTRCNGIETMLDVPVTETSKNRKFIEVSCCSDCIE